MANLFISHRGEDTSLAERLSLDLRAAGHTVRLDAWELTIGDSVPGWMNDALGTSAYVVVCYSSAGVSTPWMRREWLSALARQLEDKGVKLLPVKISGGEPPPILADLKYADLDRDWDAGVCLLLQAIR